MPTIFILTPLCLAGLLGLSFTPAHAAGKLDNAVGPSAGRSGSDSEPVRLMTMLPDTPLAYPNPVTVNEQIRSGKNVTVTWSLTPQMAPGPMNVYLYVKDSSGTSAGWEKKGTWNMMGIPSTFGLSNDNSKPSAASD